MYSEELQRAIGVVRTSKHQVAQLKQQQSMMFTEIEASKSRIKIREDSLEVIRSLMSALSQEGIQVLEGLITEGLGIVFPDRNYSVKVQVEDKRGVKQMSFVLEESTCDGIIACDVRNSVGGSIISVVSLITQIFYIRQAGGLPILFVDEAFSDISKEYHEALFGLLRIFNQKMGMNYLIITHDSGVLTYADSVYEIKDGVGVLKA